MRYVFALIVAFALVLGISPSAQAQQEITLLVPGPTKVALDKLLPEFESKTGYMVKVTYGTSMGTREQVVRGEVFDVPVMRTPYQQALDSGNVVVGSGTLIASFQVGVCVRKGAPKPDISTPEAVKKTLLDAKTITYPNPAAGTAGARVTEMFEKLGITEQIKPKSTIVENSGPAQASVASGEKDLCMAYVSDMRNPGIDVVGALPHEISSPDELFGFLSSHAKNPAASKALLDFLTSSDAGAVYKAVGMVPGH